MITVLIRNNASDGSRHLQYSDYLDQALRANGPPTGQGAERLDISGPGANEAPGNLTVGRHPEGSTKIQQRLTTETERGR
jgi:hypothetical protein